MGETSSLRGLPSSQEAPSPPVSHTEAGLIQDHQEEEGALTLESNTHDASHCYGE